MDPLLSIGRESARADQQMSVGMIQQVPSPGVQHGQDGQLCADILGVPGQLLQGRRGAAQQ